MSKQTINAKVRTVTGKSAAKKLREVGSIPAVMYNDKGEATMLEVNSTEFEKVWRSITATTSVILNVDFFVPAKDEKLVVKMKIHYTGTAAGVLKGGFMVKHLPEIRLSTVIGSLPESIVVDVSALNIGDELCVKDLNLGKDVTILSDKEASLVSISPAR